MFVKCTAQYLYSNIGVSTCTVPTITELWYRALYRLLNSVIVHCTDYWTLVSCTVPITELWYRELYRLLNLYYLSSKHLTTVEHYLSIYPNHCEILYSISLSTYLSIYKYIFPFLYLNLPLFIHILDFIFLSISINQPIN